MENEIMCWSCEMGGIKTPATGHSTNPDWSSYDLCDECQEYYNNEEPIAQDNNDN